MHGRAVFSLFVRRLPERRNYLLACGLDDVLAYLETLAFDQAALAYLDTLGRFSSRFLQLPRRRSASRATCTRGSRGHAGLRGRTDPRDRGADRRSAARRDVRHEPDSPADAARLEGVACRRMPRGPTGRGFRAAAHPRHRRRTEGRPRLSHRRRRCDVERRRRTGVRHALSPGRWRTATCRRTTTSPKRSRRSPASIHDTTLLVDTYDTMEGVGKVVRLAEALGPDFNVAAVRLDSGDLAALARRAPADARRRRTEEGRDLRQRRPERRQDRAARIAAGAPIDGFGVGTDMGVSRDAPSLDIAYKLVEYDGRGSDEALARQARAAGPQAGIPRRSGRRRGPRRSGPARRRRARTAAAGSSHDGGSSPPAGPYLARGMSSPRERIGRLPARPHSVNSPGRSALPGGYQRVAGSGHGGCSPAGCRTTIIRTGHGGETGLGTAHRRRAE